MVEEKKEEVSAETETKLEAQKNDGQKVETEKARETADTKVGEVEEVKEEQEEKPQASTLIGDLNFLTEVRKDLPTIKPGDIVRISYRVIEGGKERTQIFEGTVIAIKNSGIAKTITVRKTSFGIAVERIFPLNSKLVQKIDITKHSKIRRAKLYFLRNLKGKAARLKELR
jgi:large subunit ribosomal protein L19